MRNYRLKLREGFEVIFDINDWAKRANVSITTKCNGTVVLTTAVLGEKKNIDFTPLTIEYEEKYYAAGKIYGSRFIRREGRPSETAILNARLIDRGIRPTLKNFPYEIQITNSILSLDPEIDPDILAILASSLSFGLLGFKWNGPIGAVKISKVKDKLIVYPSSSEEAEADFTMILTGLKDGINMIEFVGNEIKEEEILKAAEIGINEINKTIDFLKSIINENVKEFLEIPYESSVNEAERFLERNNLDLEKILFPYKEGEIDLKNVFEILKEEYSENLDEYNKVYKGLLEKINKTFKEKILKDEIRPDGRKLDEIRKIEIDIGLLPRVHGSALFKRGLTHIISGTTLGSLSEELWVREIEFEGFKRFIHHYNFPSFSVGEIGGAKPPSRREIGHGSLVEKSFKYILPSEEEFPYTIRVVSDVLSSNGSTSMGSVCATSLSLLDAGVPIKNKVAGISIGLIYKNDNEFELLTDIQGPEDFFGDMDFKVAGTQNGVTSIQLDIKIEKLNLEIIKNALERARRARLEILKIMDEKISKPREKFKEGVPYVSVLKIDPSKIGLLIGPGGRVINEIIGTTNVKIDIKPDGTLYLTGNTKEELETAENWVKSVTNSLKIGDIVYGRVIKILNFGAILQIGPNKTGLLHISEIADKKIKNIEDEIKLDEMLRVKIKNISNDGKIYLSLKDAK
ncbi:MAG: polyribonucleotide nucleotidyltransferase [Minisyncoccia bacterium]